MIYSCGFWRTASTLDEAQEAIGEHVLRYNFLRTHMGIGGLVPADRYFGMVAEAQRALEADRLVVVEAEDSTGFKETQSYSVRTVVQDVDDDGVDNDVDNCPEVSNPDQKDVDGDGLVGDRGRSRLGSRPRLPPSPSLPSRRPSSGEKQV